MTRWNIDSLYQEDHQLLTGLNLVVSPIIDMFTLQAVSSNSTSNETVSTAQIVGEVSVTFIQMLSFIVLLPFILVLLICFTKQKSRKFKNPDDKKHVKDQTIKPEIKIKSPYSKNKIILFSIMLPSVIILTLLFALRILNMLAFPVATFVSAEKPLHVRVINGLIYCGWAINDWWLVVQFLFVCYIFLQTSRKLKYISEKAFKIILGAMLVIPVVLAVVILGYVITVLVDQITKVEQVSTNQTIKPALIFFYSLTTTIFIFCVLSSLSFAIWTTVRLIKHLKQSSENSGHYLKDTTKKATIRISIIIGLITLIAIFLCLMELISFIGEVSNTSVYFQVVSLIGKAIATWIFIVGLCILFGPISEMKRMVKGAIKAVNFEHKTSRALENSKSDMEMSPNTNNHQFGTFLSANQDNFNTLSSSSMIDSEPNTPISTISLS